MGKVNFTRKFSMFTDHWSPKVIAQMNDYQFKLVKITILELPIHGIDCLFLLRLEINDASAIGTDDQVG